MCVLILTRADRLKKLVQQTQNEEKIYGFGVVRAYDDMDYGSSSRFERNNDVGDQQDKPTTNIQAEKTTTSCREFDNNSRKSRTSGFANGTLPLGASAASTARVNTSGINNKTENAAEAKNVQNGKANGSKKSAVPTATLRMSRSTGTLRKPLKASTVDQNVQLEDNNSNEIAEELMMKKKEEKPRFVTGDTNLDDGEEGSSSSSTSAPIEAIVDQQSKSMRIAGRTVRLGNTSKYSQISQQGQVSEQNKPEPGSNSNNLDPLVRLSSNNSLTTQNNLSLNVDRSGKTWPFRLRRLIAPPPSVQLMLNLGNNETESKSLQNTNNINGGSQSQITSFGNISDDLQIRGNEISSSSPFPMNQQYSLQSYRASLIRQQTSYNQLAQKFRRTKSDNIDDAKKQQQKQSSEAGSNQTLYTNDSAFDQALLVSNDSDEKSRPFSRSLPNGALTSSMREASGSSAGEALSNALKNSAGKFHISATIRTKMSTSVVGSGNFEETNETEFNATNSVLLNRYGTEVWIPPSSGGKEEQEGRKTPRPPAVPKTKTIRIENRPSNRNTSANSGQQSATLYRRRKPMALSSVVVWSSSEANNFLVSGDIVVNPSA